MAGYRLAGMGDRCIASLMDSILIAAIFAVIGMAVAAQLGGVTGSGFSLNGVPAAIAIGSTLLAGFLYYLLAEGIAGVTLGKAIAGIQVRKKTGTSCGLRASMVRNVFRIVDVFGAYLVGLFVAIFSKARQRVGDHVAGTIVVENPIGKAIRATLAVLWVAAIAGGVTAAYEIRRSAPEMVSGAFAAVPSNTPVTSTGRLRAGNLALTTGPDDPVRSPAVYSGGDNVYVKYDLAGFGRDPQGMPHLLVQMQALDPGNILVHEPWSIRFNGPLPLGKPVNGFVQFELPPYAPPGSYKVDIKVQDEVNGAKLDLAPSFRVGGSAVAVPQGLEIRDFQLTSVKDGPAESTPATVAGSPIYVRANVFGLQFQNGRTQGTAKLKLFGPGSEVLRDQVEGDLNMSPFYHPPVLWLHIGDTITLSSGDKKGVYTAQYLFTDEFSNQTQTVERKFELK
jgi:uncharacterized RDD family membrane protein YckC